MIKLSNSRAKPFMWRVLRDAKQIATQRLGPPSSTGPGQPVDLMSSGHYVETYW